MSKNIVPRVKMQDIPPIHIRQNAQFCIMEISMSCIILKTLLDRHEMHSRYIVNFLTVNISLSFDKYQYDIKKNIFCTFVNIRARDQISVSLFWFEINL